jgi:hypothetical protein
MPKLSPVSTGTVRTIAPALEREGPHRAVREVQRLTTPGERLGSFVRIGFPERGITPTGPQMTLRKGISGFSDPEMERLASSEGFKYYWLGQFIVDVDTDEWDPKVAQGTSASGSKTVLRVETAFAKWASQGIVVQLLQPCAKKLVEQRQDGVLLS